MSAKTSVINTDNSCPAGTAMNYDGVVARVLGFETISVVATATAAATLSISTGITATVSERITRALAANETATLTLTITAEYMQVSCKGVGTCAVQTILHSGATNKMYSLATSTTGAQIVPTATSLTHVVDLGGVVANANMNVGVFIDSDDTTATAFAAQVSHDGVSFFDWSKFTTGTATTFQTFAVSGFRYLRIEYSNGSGDDKNITLTTQRWV